MRGICKESLTTFKQSTRIWDNKVKIEFETNLNQTLIKLEIKKYNAKNKENTERLTKLDAFWGLQDLTIYTQTVVGRRCTCVLLLWDIRVATCSLRACELIPAV